ncbi:MAG: hypothetical protein WCI80_05425 [Bacteroidota bacterium]
MQANQQTLQGMTAEELINLKEQSTAQIALNLATIKVQSDRLIRQNTILQSNITAIDAQIALLSEVKE